MVTEKTSFALLVRTVAFLLLCAVAPLTVAEEAEPGTPWPHLRLFAESVSFDAVRMNGVALELLPDGGYTARFERLDGEDGERLLAATGLVGRLDELASG